MASLIRNLKAQQFSVRCSVPRLQRVHPHVCHSGISDAAKYLQEAIEHVFHAEPDDPKLTWSESSFQGSISRNQRSRLKGFYKVIKATPREADLPDVEESEESKIAQKRYLQGALEKVFSTSKGDDGKEWTIQPFEGSLSSKREIQRMVSLISQTCLRPSNLESRAL